MDLLKRKLKRFPLGIWIALVALLLIVLAWVTKERGEALADLLWPLPLTLIALVGLWKRKIVGFVAALMDFAICIYFPLFYVFQMWGIHRVTAVAAVLLWGIPSILGIIGLWVNKSIFLKTSAR